MTCTADRALLRTGCITPFNLVQAETSASVCCLSFTYDMAPFNKGHVAWHGLLDTVYVVLG